MEFSRSDVRRALDRADVPENLARRAVPEVVLSSLEGRRRRIIRFWEDADRRRDGEPRDDAEAEFRAVNRSTLLTYAFVSEIQDGETTVDRVPGVPVGVDLREVIRAFGAVGLIQPRGAESPPVLGVALHLPHDDDGGFWLRHRLPDARPLWVDFPRLRTRLPLVVVDVERELHGAPNLVGATTTCYAVRGNVPGIIVAGHSVVNSRPGDLLDLDDGGHGYLGLSRYQPIDAAFIELPYSLSRLRDLPVVDYPTVGDDVIVQTRGGEQHRQVAQVSNTIVSPNFSDYPIVLYLDRGCSRGDSGALIRLDRTREAVGIYTGTHRARDPYIPEALGIAQNMAQAVYALGVQAKQ